MDRAAVVGAVGGAGCVPGGTAGRLEDGLEAGISSGNMASGSGRKGASSEEGWGGGGWGEVGGWAVGERDGGVAKGWSGRE